MKKRPGFPAPVSRHAPLSQQVGHAARHPFAPGAVERHVRKPSSRAFSLVDIVLVLAAAGFGFGVASFIMDRLT